MKDNEPIQDLRDFLARIEAIDEVVHIDGAEWKHEMGAIAEVVNHKRSNAPAILFDRVPGYPAGFRALSGPMNSAKRLAIALGFPEPKTALDLVRMYRDRMKHHQLIPPRFVETGPVFENIDVGDRVDLLKFPVPWINEHDGGRYIGTGDIVVMRDPDSDWVNCGTYRVQVQSKNTATIWISPGKQGRHIREKYFAAGKPCPVLVSCGHDPILTMSASNEVPFGVSEFAYAGGHRGAPIPVVKSQVYGLPMPAFAEIVLEGVLTRGDEQTEGPFGEFTGYYASSPSPQPLLRVERVYYRNDPILTIAVPMRPPTDNSYGLAIFKAGMLWDQVEAAGLQGVAGVWCHEAGAGRMFNVIAIEQRYAGHAKQAVMLAANCPSGNYLSRFTVVVDDDVDPSDLFDVLWAMCTRCDPVEDIDFIRKAWSSPLDPTLRPDATAFQSSRAVIDGCRPFDRLKTFPKVARATPEMLATVHAKFGDILNAI